MNVEQRDMWRSPEDMDKLVKKAQEDNAQQEKTKELNDKLTRLFAHAKAFKSDIEFLGAHRMDAQWKEWKLLVEGVDEMRAKSINEIPLEDIVIALDEIVEVVQVVRAEVDRIKAEEKKRKREEAAEEQMKRQREEEDEEDDIEEDEDEEEKDGDEEEEEE